MYKTYKMWLNMEGQIIKLGYATHGGYPMRVVVKTNNFPLTGESGEVEFPLHKKDLRLVKSTENVTILSLEDGESVVTVWEVSPGYRGTSTMKIIGAEKEFTYPVYRSPLGSLGKGIGAIFSFDPSKSKRVVIFWKKTGRLYGSPACGAVVFTKDGVIEVDYAENMEELEALSPVPLSMDF